MSINRRLLFLDRFLAYNRLRYRDNPDALNRLDQLQFEDMIFDGIAVDDSKPGELRRRVANFHSDAQKMEGIDQRWTCASLVHNKVIPQGNYTNSTPYASLDEFKQINAQGVYKYIDENDTTVLGVVLSTQSLTTENIAVELMTLLNDAANYQLLLSELQIAPEDYNKFPMHFTYMGDTVMGKITVIRQQAEKPSKGNELLGYFGEFPSDYVVSSGVLAEMVGIPDKLIAGQDTVPWLKFSYFGKVLYIAKQSVCNLISWNTLNAAGLATGSRIIDINGKRYKVRMIRGVASEDGNEWNDLIYRVHYQDPTETFWERFTDAELGLGGLSAGNYRLGSFVYTQNAFDASNAVYRGGGLDGASITKTSSISNTSATKDYGWRPVLEYIGTVGLTDVGVKDVYSPVQLDWKPEINTVFNGVIRPFGFSVELAPDVKIIPSAKNIVTLYTVKPGSGTIFGASSIPEVVGITNNAVRSPRNVVIDKFIPMMCDISGIQQDVIIPPDPTEDATYNGTFVYDGTLHY